MQATRRTPLADRLYAKLEPQPNGCLEFTGRRQPNGYGRISLGGDSSKVGTGLAHRVAWALANGPIPAGMDVCHTCDNPPCCNPDHLFVGTRLENMRDMVQKGRHHLAGATHCRNGHPYDEKNTYVTPKENGARCRACYRETNRERQKRYRARRKAGLV